jgi:hypothetical protein
MAKLVRQGIFPCLFILVAVPALGGNVWTEMPAPTQQALRVVKMVNRAEGWTGGGAGTILRFENGSWQNFPSGTDEEILDIAVVSADDAWAVGVSGTIVHYSTFYTGSRTARWEKSTASGVATPLPLNAVAFVNPDNGWAVGGDEARGGVVLHYNGTSWISATTTQDPLYALAPISSDNIWFCGGNRRLMRFDGSEFKIAVSPVTGADAWRTLCFPYRSEGWVAGDGGKIAKYSLVAGGWAAHAQGSSLTNASLRKMVILPDVERGCVVGMNGVRIGYSQGIFSLETPGREELYGVDVVNELEGYAVGERSMWAVMNTPSQAALRAVKVVNSSLGWAGGDAGTILKYGAGTWTVVPSDTSQAIRGFAVVSDKDSWAVGLNGTILQSATHYAGSDIPSWKQDPQSQVVTTLPLNAVAFMGTDDGWAVGGDQTHGGVVLRYNGLVWSVATLTADPLYGLLALTPNDVWFCGGNRRLMHYDGTGYATWTSPVVDSGAWRSLSFPKPSQGWVAGDGGKVAMISTSAGGWVLHVQGSGLTSENLMSMEILPDGRRGVAVGTGGVRLSYAEGVFSVDPGSGGDDLNAVNLVDENEGYAAGGGAGPRMLLYTGVTPRIYSIRTVTGEVDLKNVRVHPNPFNPRQDGRVNFDRLPSDVDALDIYTLLGEHVAGLGAGVYYNSVTGVATWSGDAIGGRSVATGSYLYRLRARSGRKSSGVLLVIRR